MRARRAGQHTGWGEGLDPLRGVARASAPIWMLANLHNAAASPVRRCLWRSSARRPDWPAPMNPDRAPLATRMLGPATTEAATTITTTWPTGHPHDRVAGEDVGPTSHKALLDSPDGSLPGIMGPRFQAGVVNPRIEEPIRTKRPAASVRAATRPEDSSTATIASR